MLTWLGARGEIVRGTNGGHWRISRRGGPRWPSGWASPRSPGTEADGYAELVRRWLARFGPGTETDLVWWLGGTKAAVRRALADLDAVEVTLDGGGTGWLLPDDVDAVGPGPRRRRRCCRSSTPRRWAGRSASFYLAPRRAFLFDTAGNAGTTAWWDGRIVGCWVQDDDGRVEVVLRDDPGRGARRPSTRRRRG